MKNKYKRRRLWVDPALQFRLLIRTGGYLVGCVFVVLNLAFLFELQLEVLQPGARQSFVNSYLDFLQRHKFVLTGVSLLLPFILFDMLKFSHRIAGPLYRCRKVMEEMGRGKPVAQFVPRKNDLLRDLFVAFNGLIDRLNSAIDAQSNGDANHVNGKAMSDQVTPAETFTLHSS
jgi:hypothetical protein